MSRALIAKLSKPRLESEPSLEGLGDFNRSNENRKNTLTAFLGEDIQLLRQTLQDPILAARHQAALEAFEDALGAADAAVGGGDAVRISQAAGVVVDRLSTLQYAVNEDEAGVIANESFAKAAAYSAAAAVGAYAGRDFAPLIVAGLKKLAAFIARIFERLVAWVRDFYAKQIEPRIKKLKSSVAARSLEVELDLVLLHALGLSNNSVGDRRWHSPRDIEHVLDLLSEGYKELGRDIGRYRMGMGSGGKFRLETVLRDLAQDNLGYMQKRDSVTIETNMLEYERQYQSRGLMEVIRALEKRAGLISASNSSFFRLKNSSLNFEKDIDRLAREISEQTRRVGVAPEGSEAEFREFIQRGNAAARDASSVLQKSLVLWTNVNARIVSELESQHKSVVDGLNVQV